MKTKSTRSIQLKIFSIAIIGGIAFCLYLYFNTMIARQNEDQVQQIISERFHELQKATVMPGYVQIITQQLGDAIGLEDPWLLEETHELANTFHADLLVLTKNYADQIRAVSSKADEQLKLPETFDNYFKRNFEIAETLIEKPELFDNYIEDFHKNKEVFTSIEKYTESLSQIVIDSYHQELMTAQTLMHKSIQFGIAGGFTTAFLLFVIAAIVSRNVGAAIQASDKLKNDFLATISHELRTPLNGISGALNLLRTSNSPELQASLTKTACDATCELSRMIDDILLFAELRSSEVKPQNLVLNQDSHIRPLVRQFQERCQQKGLQFNYKLVLPAYSEIQAPWPSIIKAVQTLLSNSLKFTQNGEISLRIELDHNKNHQQYLVVTVSDTGVGISEENQKRLFNSFQQLDSNFNRQHGGLGLGLATLWMQMQLLQGEIKLESKEDQGSTFKLIIPVNVDLVFTNSSEPETNATEITAQPANDVDDSKDDIYIEVKQDAPTQSQEKPETAEKKIIEQSTTLPTRKLQQSQYDVNSIQSKINQANPDKSHLLVVEDNPINQMIIGAFIQKLGCTYTCVSNGQQALDWLAENKNKAKCILMDCQMPVMDGFTATTHIRASNDVYASIPIIAVTANAMAKDQAKCLEVGMDDYLKKPLDIDALKEKLVKHDIPLDPTG